MMIQANTRSLFKDLKGNIVSIHGQHNIFIDCVSLNDYMPPHLPEVTTDMRSALIALLLFFTDILHVHTNNFSQFYSIYYVLEPKYFISFSLFLKTM